MLSAVPVILCYVMLCYVMLCYAILCYVLVCVVTPSVVDATTRQHVNVVSSCWACMRYLLFTAALLLRDPSNDYYSTTIDSWLLS